MSADTKLPYHTNVSLISEGYGLQVGSKGVVVGYHMIVDLPVQYVVEFEGKADFLYLLEGEISVISAEDAGDEDDL